MQGRGLLVGCVVGAVIASAVGVAYAAIPDGGGVVHACFQNVTSANKPVKLLNTSQQTACPKGWSAVSWNQQGRPGPTGVSGYETVVANGGSDSTNAVGSHAGTTLNQQPTQQATAYCSSGKKV